MMQLVGLILILLYTKMKKKIKQVKTGMTHPFPFE